MPPCGSTCVLSAQRLTVWCYYPHHTNPPQPPRPHTHTTPLQACTCLPGHRPVAGASEYHSRLPTTTAAAAWSRRGHRGQQHDPDGAATCQVPAAVCSRLPGLALDPHRCLLIGWVGWLVSHWLSVEVVDGGLRPVRCVCTHVRVSTAQCINPAAHCLLCMRFVAATTHKPTHRPRCSAVTLALHRLGLQTAAAAARRQRRGRHHTAATATSPPGATAGRV